MQTDAARSSEKLEQHVSERLSLIEKLTHDKNLSHNVSVEFDESVDELAYPTKMLKNM